MSTDVMVPTVDGDNNAFLPTEAMATSGTELNESELILASDSGVLLQNDERVFNVTNNVTFPNEINIESEYLLFQKFVITEIIMTALELIVSVLAAAKMPRWRKNYRNQMLLQLTLTRFLKRIVYVFQFLEYYRKIPSTPTVNNILTCFQFYIDFVIVILVFFFIKHMYNSLIIVIVKVSQNDFFKVLICSWLVPVPISTVCTVLIAAQVTEKSFIYLLMSCIFRWPLILVGTGLYLVIVYRVLADKIRQFASSLAMVTFLLCLILNIYLFSKDVIELFCKESFSTKLISYVSGFLLNLLILCLYIILILFSINKTQASRSELPDYSLAEAKCENVLSIEND